MKWLVALLLPVAAQAQSLPDGSFFTGWYEMVGRASDGPYTDRLEITGEDFPLALRSCRHGTGTLDVAVPDHEGAAPLAGELNGRRVACRFLGDGDNYPVLNCYWAEVEGYGPVTFWPRPEAALTDAPKDCP